MFGIVTNDAFSGDITKSPFNYLKHDVLNVQLSIDGKPLPTRPLEMTNYARAYDNLFRNTGQYGKLTGCGITRKQFENGSLLYVFNCRKDQSSRQDIFPYRRTGTVSLRVTFENTTSEGLVVVVMSEFDQIYNIDKLRNITSDHGTH